MRVGIGVDAHRFASGRRLVLGGIEIEHPRGLLGHSDADVVSHAVADCLLGAAGLGDLGRHFPDSDPRWKGICSLEILKIVASLLSERGLRVVNVDVTVICEVPKLAPHRASMESRIAQAICCGADQVSVKATTTEGMGYEGRGEGISAWAVGLVTEKEISSREGSGPISSGSLACGSTKGLG